MANLSLVPNAQTYHHNIFLYPNPIFHYLFFALYGCFRCIERQGVESKYHIYAKSLAGGQVNPVTGEFNFGCREAYLIRDGKVCEPVRGASVIGTGQDILMKIDMIGNDLERGQGMCGAASGFIPVDVGQPTIRISEITVGGNGGELK